MTTPTDTLRRSIEQYRGDNLNRARAAFRGMTAEQMQQEYGASGLTRAEILAGYEQHEQECDAALAYLESLK